ncbi:MAG: oxidoreductase [Gammaproteobacteria bacterium]|nr:oxidoreductase [Gammaproteobacteria bacterium]
MTEALRVGIAGYGVVGKRRRQYIDANPLLRTVAVSDVTFQGNGILEDGTSYFDNYVTLLDQDLDVLFVCLSNDVAATATIGGLERSFHVFCEKPPGRDMNDIASVREVSQRRPNQVLKYGFNHRYHDSIQEALRIIQSRELGEIINLRGVYGKSKLISWGQTTWRTKREKAGGGILLDQGIHMVDLLRLFAGEFKEVHSFISNDFWNKDVEDNAYAILRTADGKIAMLHSSATSWRHRFELQITLSKGALVLTGILSSSKSYGNETLTISHASHDERGDPKEETICYKVDPSWAREVEEFTDSVISGHNIINGSVDDAYSTMELVYRIYCADSNWQHKWGLDWQL